MKINLPKTYSQNGNYTPIGNSTINAIGCLTVDAAMAATYFGHNIDPTTLAQKVKYSGNLWIWGELTRLFPDIKYEGQTPTPNRLSDAQMNQIKGCIDRGYPVFLLIKTQHILEHWLLAVDYNGDDFICADPLKPNGTPHAITDYGIPPREVIYSYAWYSGPVSNNSTPGSDYYRGYDLTNKDSMKVAVDQMIKIIDGEYIEKGALEQYKKDHPVSTSEQAEKDKQKNEEIAKKDTIISGLSKQAESDKKKIEDLQKLLDEKPDEAKLRDEIREEIETTIIINLFKKQ